MKRWLRHHRYALRVALRRLRLHPFSTLANIIVIALMLSVPILGAAVLQSSQPLAHQLASAPEISLFLAQDTPEKTQQELTSRVGKQAGVAQARLVTRTQAMNMLRADPAWAQALDALPENPLPDIIIATLQNTDAPAQTAAALADAWRDWPGVDHVQLDSAWVQRLESLLAFVRIGLGMLAAAVVLVVLASVFNTVRLQALTQREEIAVARLVGATEPFVRRPFLYLGALTGLAASLLALLLAWLALAPLNSILGHFAQSYGVSWAIRLPPATSLLWACLLVMLLGAVSARLSVTRHTRF